MPVLLLSKIRFRSCRAAIVCILLAAVHPLPAQFEPASDSFDETVKKVATEQPSAPAKNVDRFEEKYLDVLRKALGSSGDDLDPNFWANAYQLVFGERTNDAAAAAAARQLFATPGELPTLTYSPISEDTPAYVPGPSGDAMEAELQAALDALEKKENATPAECLAVITKMAPFLRTLTAEDVAKVGGISIPDGGKLVYEATPYCLQHNLPAPSAGAGMWLIPSRALIPKPALPIYEALLKWSEGHSRDNSSIQSLLWAIREANDRPYTALREDQRRVLNAALKDGAELFLEFMGMPPASKRASAAKAAASNSGSTDTYVSFPSATDDPFNSPTNERADLASSKRKIAQSSKSNAGIVVHGLDPRDPAQTQEILRRLAAARPPAASSAANAVDDAYTLLSVGVAARTTTTVQVTLRTEIINRSGKTFIFRPQDHIGMTRQRCQPFAFTTPSVTTIKIDWEVVVVKTREIVTRANLILRRKAPRPEPAQNPTATANQPGRSFNPGLPYVIIPPLAVEIDSVEFRYRLFANFSGDAARYDRSMLETDGGVPEGASISVRDQNGKLLNVIPHSPLTYRSSLAPAHPSFDSPKHTGPLSDWFTVSELSARLEARDKPDSWYEFQILFDVGTGSPILSAWTRISPDTVRKWNSN